jgi:hypothetical protein
MHVPSARRALIAPEKITDYLLNLSHDDGASKARFLLRFGFSLDTPVILRDALLYHVRTYEVVRTMATQHVTRYDVHGPLPSPDGRDPLVWTGWYIRHGEEIPRFATLVPDTEGRRLP